MVSCMFLIEKLFSNDSFMEKMSRCKRSKKNPSAHGKSCFEALISEDLNIHDGRFHFTGTVQDPFEKITVVN